MSHELEAAAADSLGHLFRRKHRAGPRDGALCANCGAVLQGPWCHACGQEADTHHRSILHLAWEAIEGLLHLDGRLARTLPDLFLRPGRLAKDYMEGRVVRHVPPFRTFLVALLLFIFAAEHAAHEITLASQRQNEAEAAALTTPQGRATVAASRRVEAAKDHTEALADAAKDRADDLKDPDAKPDKVQARYAAAVARANASYAATLDRANRLAQGLPTEAPAAKAAAPAPKRHARSDWWEEGLRKAQANPEYYLTVLFTWGHRLAVLLLPILGLSLALVYRNRRQYFIYDHLLVAMNLLSFAFLTNALGLVLPSPLVWWWLLFAALWAPVNMFQTLRGAYGSSVLGAGLKTLVVWTISVCSFSALLVGLVLFSLAQL